MNRKLGLAVLIISACFCSATFGDPFSEDVKVVGMKKVATTQAGPVVAPPTDPEPTKSVPAPTPFSPPASPDKPGFWKNFTTMMGNSWGSVKGFFDGTTKKKKLEAEAAWRREISERGRMMAAERAAKEKAAGTKKDPITGKDVGLMLNAIKNASNPDNRKREILEAFFRRW